MSQVMTHGRPYARDRDEAEYDEHRARPILGERLQYAKYGGIKAGADFFGWLVSMGLAAILTGILAAAGSAVALNTVTNVNNVTGQTAATVGVVGGILLLIVLAISYFCGGYVAGRMARFDGARQGFGVWLWGIVIAVLLGLAGAALGAKYNVLQQLNLPHLPMKGSSLTTGGLITTLAALLITLLAAIVGGKVGQGYHRKVDAAAAVDNRA